MRVGAGLSTQVSPSVRPAALGGGWEERGWIALGNAVWVLFLEKEEGRRTSATRC